MILTIFVLIVVAGLLVAVHEIVDASLKDNESLTDENCQVNTKPQLELLKALEKKK